ncbi:MAG: hypothetical protein N3F07_04245 [Candidatus Micrarchaeota archaeon]|nr:hypothetical protein [Candidatus Micrarchaeota archaeon]
MRLLAALLCAILLSGCAQDKPKEAFAAEASPEGFGSQGRQKIELAESIDYTAKYSISDGSGEISKTVWRKGKDARIQYAADGRIFADVLILSGTAYSCTTWKENPECMVVDAQNQWISQGAFPQPDFSLAEPDEEVEIGATKGACFLFPYTVNAKRKMCFDQFGILAYDEYPLPSGKKHVEYLVWLRHSADSSELELPAKPKPMPKPA